ncbi:MAG: twitching motility protein PilT [Eubacterium sp.]|nr:twitching motility protein PilT [Eubacterium sp.]
MVQLVIGAKGKGKTTFLLETVGKNLDKATGNSVYVDNSQKHMYDLSNKVRLINSGEYSLKNKYEFIGFLCGIASQDNDLEYVYIDNLMVQANMGIDDLEGTILRLNELGDLFDINFVVTASATEDQIVDSIKKFVTTSL